MFNFKSKEEEDLIEHKERMADLRIESRETTHSVINSNKMEVMRVEYDRKEATLRLDKEYEVKKATHEAEMASLNNIQSNRRDIMEEEVRLHNESIEVKKEVVEEKVTLLKEAFAVKESCYKEMIDLLKTQVEVLTAKLTEIKISDVHMHVDAKMESKK